MAVEEELFEGLVQVFRKLHQMVQKFRGTRVSRRTQRQVLREEMRDWLKNGGPQADAVRQQIKDQTFEQRVAAAVNRILDDRFAPENAAEQNRDPQQINHPTFEQWVEAEVNRILDERFGPENAAEQNRDPQQVEAPEAEQGQEAETPEAKTPEAEQQGSVLGQTDDGQLVSPDVVGEDAPAPDAEQDNNPIFDQLMREQAERQAQEQQVVEQADNPIFEQLMTEQAERQGQERSEGEQAASPAGDDHAETGDANKQEGQGQAATAQRPELPADMQKLQDLQNSGRPSPVGAVQGRDGAPAASPPAGATSGAHHRTPPKDRGGRDQ